MRNILAPIAFLSLFSLHLPLVWYLSPNSTPLAAISCRKYAATCHLLQRWLLGIFQVRIPDRGIHGACLNNIEIATPQELFVREGDFSLPSH